MAKRVAIVQARMGSSRLPGKVMLDLAGAPVLARVVARVSRARQVDLTLVATSERPADDLVEAWCAAQGVTCVRGSEQDVLDRYYHAAVGAQADVVVRITADCPLIDPGVIDEVVAAFERERPDYASNVLPTRSFPRGLDVEVLSFAALEKSWREDRDPAFREHVTCYIEAHPELFRTACVVGAVDQSHHRWTLDTPQDYELLARIYRHFGHDRFGWTEVLALLEAQPDWVLLNRDVAQKTVTSS